MSLRRSSRRKSTDVSHIPKVNGVNDGVTSSARQEGLAPEFSYEKKKRPPKSTVNGSSSTARKRKATPVPSVTASASSRAPITGFLSAGYSTGDIDDCTPPLMNKKPRVTHAHMTNAPLKTPKGSRVLANPAAYVEPSSPSKVPEPETTTETLLETACAHLIRVDPRLKHVVQKHHCRIFSPEGLAEEIDPFRSLASGVIAQQVSGAAAKSIKAKFVKLFNDDDANPVVFPTPAQVAATDITRLRSAGLSQRKAEYIQGIAEKFTSGELSTKMLAEGSDEEVLQKLTAVRGLGKWSVEMFACFALKRTDIFSTGDLGVQRGMAAYIGRDVAKLKNKGGGKWKYMTEKEMLDISEKFAPYRSLFMWYMWRIEDVDTDAIEKV